MRRRESLPDPEVVHGLRELDAALAGQAGADPELTELVTAVRSARPEADAAFLASLDARVHAGFPRPDGSPRRRRAWRPAVLLPAMGVAAAALVALVVALPGSGGDHPSRQSPDTTLNAAPAPASGAPAPESASAGAGSSSSSAAAPAPASGQTKSGAATPSPPLGAGPAGPRKVEQAVQLTLTPAPADVQTTADGVVRETQAVGGYVENSQVSTGDSGGSASFTLRVPSARLDDALARLSKLAHVGALTQSATDITGAFTSAESRLSDARAERRALLRALGRATTDRQIGTLRARLADNRSQISARNGELDALRRRADLTTVGVTIEGTGKPKAGGGAWTPRDALHDAGRVLQVAGGVAVIALAVLLPLGILALLALLAARALRRRRREIALDRL
jgi:hypothetical protein